MKPFLSRRTVLRGAGVSIALPWLEAMSTGSRRAHAAAPKRCLFFVSPNGYNRSAWATTGSETAFTLGRSLKPLEAHIRDVVVLNGVDNVAATRGPGDDHKRGMGTLLTGTENAAGGERGGGISVDQEIVRRLAPPTKFPSLEIGVRAHGYSSYRGSAQGLPLENSPSKLFARVFGDLSAGAAAGPDPAIERIRSERKSILDAAARSYEQLAPRLGREDRAKLESHAQTIRELEKRLAASPVRPASVVACAKPTGASDAGDLPTLGKQQMDLLATALACDLTRVATLQWTGQVSNMAFSWIGVSRGHHDLSHDADGNAASQESIAKIDTWYAEQFAYLIGKLKSISEEGGTALDKTVLLWVNELSRGNVHSHPDMPYVLAGRAGGRIKTGRLLKFGTVPHNNLLLSIMNAMDVPATTFGNPAYCSGPLAGL